MKENVRQVGHPPELYKDARSGKKRILNVSCKLKEKLFENGYYVEEWLVLTN
jgi:hypothetical protein